MQKILMRRINWISIFRASRFLCAAVLIPFSPVTLAASEQVLEDRSQYRKALNLIDAGQITRARAVADQLSHYPAAPYIEYHIKRKNLSRVSAASMRAFRQSHADLPATELLFRRWLVYLGQSRQWSTLHANAVTTSDPELLCYQLRAQYAVADKGSALDATTPLWLAPKSQPKACDPLFATWRKSTRFTEDVAWIRLEAAIRARQRVLARYLLRYFDTKKAAANAFYALYSNPSRILRYRDYQADDPDIHAAIVYGLERLSREQPTQASEALAHYRAQQRLTPEQIQRAESAILVGLAKIGRFPDGDVSSEFSESAAQGLLDAAIVSQTWDQVLIWSKHLTEPDQARLRTRYWVARALMAESELSPAAAPENSDHQRALEIFGELAQMRHYYGFLAAERASLKTAINGDIRRFLTEEEELSLRSSSGIARAVELFALGDDVNGRREWYREIEGANNAKRHQMAQLARRLGRLFLSIQTANMADALDDLRLRFPEAYQAEFGHHANRHGLEANLLQAISRQESAFKGNARSSAGALGLMQMMPATAALVARRVGLSKPDQKALLTPTRNIELASAHVGWLLERYDQQRPPAIAAYNAGENRVDRWLRAWKQIPADVWIESIPFTETRNYVKNVLAFNVVYAQLAGRSVDILKPFERQLTGRQRD